jgi:hypothetical protein
LESLIRDAKAQREANSFVRDRDFNGPDIHPIDELPFDARLPQ